VSIRSDTTIVRSSSCLAVAVGEETVVMSVERGRYYAFDPIGGDIWSRLAAPRTVRNLCESLAVDYDATPETIEADVISVLDELAGASLVEIMG